MHRKKALSIFRLDESATEEDIRKKYRKLVMLYHPDKNKAPDAQEHFIQITRAYDVLTKSKQGPQTSMSRSQSQRKEKTAKERMTDAKLRYYEQFIKEQQETDAYFTKLTSGAPWKFMRNLMYLSSFVLSMLVLDLILPSRFVPDEIAYYQRKHLEGGEIKTPKIWTKNGETFFLKDFDQRLYLYQNDIYIEQTPIFHLNKKIISYQWDEIYLYPLQFNWYWAIYALLLFLSLPILTYFFKRKTVYFTLIYHLSLYLTPLILIGFLISNNHLVHLISFGFL